MSTMNDTTLFCDLKTDEEKSNFFLSGRGYETGIIALSIQNDVAMAYHRCAEYRKELEDLRENGKQAVPEGKVLVDRGVLNMVINALRRDAEEGKVVRGEMADALLSAEPMAAENPDNMQDAT